MVVSQLSRGIAVSVAPSESTLLLLLIWFTISSAPEDPFISVHIRQVGDFTKALASRLGVTPRSEKLELMEIELGDEKTDFGRRGDWIEVGPSMGVEMPKLRIDG